jgi:phospholipid/cholesterol/gamma-HCH transport system substrate-binding protein
MALSNETKVGLLVVVALGGLAWLSLRTGAFFDTTSGGRALSSVFSSVDGITVGSPVKMAGVKVGEVNEIVLQPNGTAVLKFKVENTVPLAADTAVKIDTSGIIGERFVALVPGTASASGQVTPLPATATSLPSLGGGNGDVTGNFTAVSDDLKQMTSTLRSVLGNEENVAKIQTIIDGLASFSGSLQSDSGSIISDLKVASASLKDILAGGDAAQTKEMITNFSKVAANMASITDKLERGEGPLGAMLQGGGTSGTNVLADLNGAMRDFRETMAKVNGGEGTLGKLVNDKEMAAKLEDAIGTFSEASNRISALQTELSFEGASLVAENGVAKSGANLVIRPQGTDSPHFYVGGVAFDGFASRADDKDERNGPYFGKEFGNDAKYTAQYGRFFKQALPGTDVAVRVGMKDSTGGLGVDATRNVLGKNAKLSADLYDFGGSNMPDGDTPQLDVKARIDLVGKTVYGVVGYDNVLNQEYGSPVVGAGVRFVDEDLKYLLGQAL